MLDLVALFIPPYAAQLLLAGLGIAVLFGIVRPKRAITWILIGAGLYLMEPFVGLLIRQLPRWLVLAGAARLAITIVRHVLESLLGTEAAGHVVGASFVAVRRGAIRCATVPFWCAGAITRMLTRRRGL